ncbi:MAG TPA: endonuclease/exonuclease/phosphatase family protein [Verrucomicrobiae bacterium]
MTVRVRQLLAAVLATLVGTASVFAAETFRVATYNVANYLDQDGSGRAAKTSASRAKVRESIKALKPDVIALEEMGEVSALRELQSSLKAEGLDLPHWEHVKGWDTNIHVAVLSKFPITARRPHTNDSFLLSGRRFRVNRGFVEVDIEVSPTYRFTLFAAHLKSKRAVPEADEAELRLQEARILREKIDARLAADPRANIVVVGDFNDTKDARSTKAIIGLGKGKLVDTRPAERNGDTTPPANPNWDPPNITWTHFYGKEDSYSRIDYIMVNQNMAREWVKEETYVLALPNWGLASDHRPIVATFTAEDK